MTKLTCNAVLRLDEPPRNFRAKICWEGCTFSDGTLCTKDILDRLLLSVSSLEGGIPLLMDHNWEPGAIVGRSTSWEIDSGALFGRFDVTNWEAYNKIQDGTFKNVSLTFEIPNYNIMEVSIVAVPAIRGAGFVDNSNKGETKMKKDDPAFEDDKPEEGTETSEPITPVEDNGPEDDDKEDDDKEDGKEEDMKPQECKDKTKKNSEVERLMVEVEALRRENTSLAAELRENSIDNELKKLVSCGAILPANYQLELEFCRTLSATQFSTYIKNRTTSAKANAFGGPQISKKGSPATSSGFSEIYAERLAKKSPHNNDNNDKEV